MLAEYQYDFPTPTSEDFFRMFCGDLIGEGSARAVYQYRMNSNWVVKVESGVSSFQNIMEWETWARIMETEHAKWFAPCRYISPCGNVLIQQKTAYRGRSDYPLKIPAFFTDTKYDNFGFIGKQLVCHDYGIHLLMEKGMTRRMRGVQWWV